MIVVIDVKCCEINFISFLNITRPRLLLSCKNNHKRLPIEDVDNRGRQYRWEPTIEMRKRVKVGVIEALGLDLRVTMGAHLQEAARLRAALIPALPVLPSILKIDKGRRESFLKTVNLRCMRMGRR